MRAGMKMSEQNKKALETYEHNIKVAVNNRDAAINGAKETCAVAVKAAKKTYQETIEKEHREYQQAIR